MTSWKTLFLDSKYNNAIVAGATESYVSTENERANNAPFNFLVVTNRDIIDIKIMLDGLTTAGKFYEIAGGGFLVLNPEDDETFSFIKQENLHATDAETADLILFKWGRKIKSGD